MNQFHAALLVNYLAPLTNFDWKTLSLHDDDNDDFDDEDDLAFARAFSASRAVFGRVWGTQKEINRSTTTNTYQILILI